MTLFEANYIHVGEVDGVFMVGFADHKYDTKHYLLFQLSDDEGEIDVEKIYLERNDQSQSTYGGITSCELYTDRFLLQIDAQAVQLLNTNKSFQIIFTLKQEELEQLARGLKVLFAATDVFKVHV